MEKNNLEKELEEDLAKEWREPTLYQSAYRLLFAFSYIAYNILDNQVLFVFLLYHQLVIVYQYGQMITIQIT